MELDPNSPRSFCVMNKSQFKLFLKFLKYLFPYRKKQATVLILSGASVLLGLINPYLSKLVVDKAIINKELKTFIILGLIGTGVFILNGLINAIESFLKRGIRLKVGFDLNKKVFSHLQNLPLDFFKNKSTGECMFRINYDIERAVDLVVSVPEESVNIFPKLLFILAIIFYLDWPMAIFSLVLTPILYLPIYYLTRRMRRVLEELISNSQNIFKRLQEIFSHIYLVKALGKEKTEIRNYLRILISNTRVNLKNARLEIISDFSGGSFNRIIIGLITLFGGYQVIRGRITAGTLTAIMIYLSQLIGLQSSIAFFFQRIVFGLVSCKRLDDILQEKPKVKENIYAKKMVFKEPKIQFRKVSFGYNPGEYILRGLDFDIEKGFIALVGASGCGKTTILNLILRLYQPWRGEIFIEGRNIKDLELSSLRAQIGIALQEPFLWNDTIENNIKYAMPDAKEEEIIKVATIAGVDGFIKDLPSGYQAIIGENACKLSEGQKQKIAIARAFVRKPKILILDEAMSSMDSQGEKRIIAQIKQSLEIPTVVIVSHRLSTVLSCDLVYFFKSPDKMVIDKPSAFIERDKAFYDLFASQIKEPSRENTAVNPV